MRTRAVAALVAVLLVAAATSFVVPTPQGRSSPASFDSLVTTGVTQTAAAKTTSAGGVLPRAEAFYAQYRYGVGYRGVRVLLADLSRPSHRRQFGRPLAIYVSDFTGTNVTLTSEGYLNVSHDPGWVRASEAAFVVNGSARTAAGPAVVPFSTRRAADAFARQTSGRVEDWATLRANRTTPVGGANAMRASVTAHEQWANQTAGARRQLLDRPVSRVVGQNGTTLRSALRTAPANTTIRVPPGTYNITGLTITRPLTLRGAGNETRIVGRGNGTVVTVNASRSAVADVSISGVGHKRVGDTSNATGWASRERAAYALADSAVRFVNATDSLAAGLAIRTPANGVTLLGSDGSVVTNTTVIGNIPWRDGYMGVLAFDSRVVVQNSHFDGGRDGIYTHAAHGSVVRNSTMQNLRYGVHEMYTSRMLLEGNRVRHARIGLVVMTHPDGNLVVGNTAKACASGVVVRGRRNYVADNTLVDGGAGLLIAGSESVYTGNALVHDNVGARVLSTLPDDRVTGNDFVADDRAVKLGQFGPLYVWNGNYWTNASGVDRNANGILDQGYWPTSAIGRQAGTAAGVTLARSPAVGAVRTLQQTLPGIRREGVVDERPRASEANPGAVSHALSVPPASEVGPPTNVTRHV